MAGVIREPVRPVRDYRIAAGEVFSSFGCHSFIRYEGLERTTGMLNGANILRHQRQHKVG